MTYRAAQQSETETAAHVSGVYVLHFDRQLGDTANPYGAAGHYLGSAEDIADRVAEHRAGQGSKITAYAVAAGIKLHLARVIRTAHPYTLEKVLKSRKNTPRLCPICNPTNHTN